MKRFSVCFTRERHINLLEPHFRELAEKWFDDIAGKGKSHIEKVRIEEMQHELLSSFSKIESYVNTQIAHFSKNQTFNKVTFEDIRNVIVSFYKVYNWCLRLISQAVLSSPVSTPQSNWLKYFKIPWIKPGSEIPSYRHLNELINESIKI